MEQQEVSMSDTVMAAALVAMWGLIGFFSMRKASLRAVDLVNMTEQPAGKPAKSATSVAA